MKKNKDLLEILKKRYTLARDFTKENYLKQALRSMNDYDTKEAEIDLSTTYDRHKLNVNDRYEMIIPLIFTNTEAMKASMFERLPDLIFKGRGQQDSDKKNRVEAAYEYLKDKLDLLEVANQAAHWFILTGFTSVQANYEKRGEEVNTGMVDEMGEPIMDIKYVYDDPIVEVNEPAKIFYSPESKFDFKSDKIPYYFLDKLMTPYDIEKIYNKKVKADSSLEAKDELEQELEGGNNKDKEAGDMDRVKVRFYCGQMPEQGKDHCKEFGLEFLPDKVYYIIFTEDEILHISDKTDKYLRCAKWYGHPSKFFGFGLGKIGRIFQIEKTIRRGQQMRLADVAAYPKYAMKDTDTTNNKDLLDPRANVIVQYSETPPSILQPGNLADIVSVSSAEADNDAQKAFGMLDLSSGQQSSTVDTATGQTIFAEAAQKRIAFAKKNFMAFYREMIIMLLKLCQENWDEEKLVSITDENGQEVEMTLTSESLADIDFDRDIDINLETLSTNKDVVRQQYIVLYDKTKDDPLIERSTIIKDMLRNGFEVTDPERYIKENGLEPGTMLLNQQTGEQYQVGEDGEIVSAAQQQEVVEGGAGGEMAQGIPTNPQEVNQMLPEQEVGY